MKKLWRYAFFSIVILSTTLALSGYWYTYRTGSHVITFPRLLKEDLTQNECQQSCEAIVTLITDDSYLLAALVLGYTLKKHSATISRDIFAIMPNGTINDAYHLKMLKQIGWTIAGVKPMFFPGKVIPRFKHGLLKLHAWKMTQYRGVAMLDADTMLIGSIEEPFQYLRQQRETQLLGVNDPYLTRSREFIEWKGQYFNSGVLFFRPSVKHFSQLVQHSSNKSYYNLNYPQQNLLNTYYRNHWREISPIYNFPDYLSLADSLRKKYDIKSRRIMHFAGDIKPWYSTTNNSKQSKPVTEATNIWRRLVIDMMMEYEWTKQDFVKSRVVQDLWLDHQFQQLLNKTLGLSHRNVFN